jgi:hypothetical protein
LVADAVGMSLALAFDHFELVIVRRRLNLNAVFQEKYFTALKCNKQMAA